MTEDLLKGLWNMLASDTALIGQLTTYTPTAGASVPAIFTTNPAPKGAEMPYIIISGSAVPEETNATERMTCTVDVYARSASAIQALRIGQRVEKLWDFKTPFFPNITMLGIIREAKGMIPEDDDEIQHLHLQFLIRYCRNDLLA